MCYNRMEFIQNCNNDGEDSRKNNINKKSLYFNT